MAKKKDGFLPESLIQTFLFKKDEELNEELSKYSPEQMRTMFVAMLKSHWITTRVAAAACRLAESTEETRAEAQANLFEALTDFVPAYFPPNHYDELQLLEAIYNEVSDRGIESLWQRIEALEASTKL